MADIAGIGGAVAIPSTLGMSPVEWSGTLDVDVVTLPAAFGQKWEGAALGQGRFSGSLTGRLQYGVANTKVFDPSEATTWTNLAGVATLTAFTGCTITGSMIFNNIAISRPNSGDVTVTMDFRNSGNDLTVVWAVI